MGTTNVTADTPMFSRRTASALSDLKSTEERAKMHRKILRHPHMKQILKRLNALPSINEIDYLTVNQAYSRRPEDQYVRFDIHLKQEVKKPELVRDLIRSGIARKLTKSVGYGGGSLRVTGELFTDLALAFKVKVAIEGYVPSTCKVIEEEIFVPAHTEKRTKVVCGPDQIDGSAIGTDAEQELTSANVETAS